MDILGLLEEKKILLVNVNDDGCELTEACDYFYAVSLSKDEVLALADEFNKLAESMK